MGRPSIFIASTSRITQSDIIAYTFAMAKAENFQALFLMEPNHIRTWLNEQRPYNAKIIEQNGKRSLSYGEIYSTPPEARASETITTATLEEIRNSALKLRIARLKRFKARSQVICAAENISYQYENGDVANIRCPNGSIPLDADKSEDKALIAQIERAKYLSTISDLSERDREVNYQEVKRGATNQKGAQVASLLNALAKGSIDLESFKASANKLNKDIEKNKNKNTKRQGTISCIGMWGK